MMHGKGQEGGGKGSETVVKKETPGMGVTQQLGKLSLESEAKRGTPFKYNKKDFLMPPKEQQLPGIQKAVNKYQKVIADAQVSTQGTKVEIKSGDIYLRTMTREDVKPLTKQIFTQNSCMTNYNIKNPHGFAISKFDSS